MSNLSLSFELSSVERGQLSNGLTMIMQEDHSLPIVTSLICYGVGSRHDPKGCAGLSHFTEHMLFKGTSKYQKGEIDYLTTINGGFNNAFTSLDYTAYYFAFSSDRWIAALEIEADRMQDNLFDEVEFNLERQVILEELKMELDSPWGALRHRIESEAFLDHPYGHPVIGFLQDVERIQIDEMVDYYRCFYAPDNAILVLVGDFDIDAVAPRVETLFGNLSPAGHAIDDSVSDRNPGRKGWLVVDQPSHVERVVAAGPAPAHRDEDLFAVLLLEKLLTHGELSRLNDRLVETEGLVAMIDSEISETRDPYLLVIQAELVEGKTPEQVRSAILQEFERLAGEEISQAELVRARNQCLHDFIADQETGVDRAIQFGLAQLLGDFERLSEFPDRLAGVTISDIGAAAARYLQPDQFLWVVSRTETSEGRPSE